MLSCKEVSRLVSESLDRKLPWRQRIGVWLHLMMCRLCFGFRKDMLRLREAARQHAEAVEDDADESQATLSDEARQRIQKALQDHPS